GTPGTQAARQPRAGPTAKWCPAAAGARQPPGSQGGARAFPGPGLEVTQRHEPECGPAPAEPEGHWQPDAPAQSGRQPGGWPEQPGPGLPRRVPAERGPEGRGP